MIDFQVTQEEKDLLLKRRELFEKRKKNGIVVVEKRKQKQPVTNPAVAAASGSKCAPHHGRVTDPSHEMHWFETLVFANITNMEHQKEHRNILELLKMPVQASNRDRVYHQLCHLDVLWSTYRLPLHLKRRYEEYKKKYNIDDTNMHPDLKESNVEYPKPQNKRPWDEKLYEKIESIEKFDPHREYRYEPDIKNDKAA